MKSVGQLLLGLLTAAGSALIILAAASLALVEGGVQTAALSSPVPLQPSATGMGLTVTSVPTQLFTLTATRVQPTSCATPEGWVLYVVQPGDTLETIAAQVGITVEQIRKANCLTSSGLIPNTTLYLPFAKPTPTAPTALPTVLPSGVPTVMATVLPSSTPIPCGPPRGWIIYIVRPGDTLFRLSLAFGISQYQLQTANCMTGTYLYAGQTLYVPNVPTRVPSFTKTPTEQPVPSDTPETPVVVPTTAVPPTAEPTLTNTPEPTLEPTAQQPTASITDTPAAPIELVTPASTQQNQ